MIAPGVDEVWGALRSVVDPELPFLTIEELGVLREVRVEDGIVHVTITPTYSGCPAMDEIRSDVLSVLRGAGWERVEVETALAPPWTTDWMDESAREKLRESGIAPPQRSGPVAVTLHRRRVLPCPLCASEETEEISRFGSTSCKSLWRCLSCREPFEHMRDF